MKKSLLLKRLCYTGPGKKDAYLEFHSGLNIIYGASDSGKSFILESISFMLGSGTGLRDIPERVGYDRVWLSLVRPDGTVFTLTRSTEGGDYNLYEGEVNDESESGPPVILKHKHDAKKSDNLSSYLLRLIGAEGKRLKSKADGTVVRFTASYLRHLCLVSETDIQKQSSPILTGQHVTKTPELAAFKFLLTGIDDSGLIKSIGNSPAVQSREAKRELLEELLISYHAKLDKMSGQPILGDELASQLEKLDKTLLREAENLKSIEASHGGIAEKRVSLRQLIERSLERQAEISDLLERFRLLNAHYISDVRRLEGIREAGSLMAALAPGQCPLCGSDGIRPHQNLACDGNLDIVVAAATAEREKVERLRADLEKTVTKLQSEAKSFEEIIPEKQLELARLDARILELAPSVTNQRLSYQTLVEQRATVRSMRDVWDEIEDLQVRKAKLDDTQKTTEQDGLNSSELPSSVIDEFDQLLEKTLQAWHFPGAARVHFDSQKKDFIISGKLRGSRGKGMRAITHAAFTVTLLEFCQIRSLPHFGFVVMDTPLLAYREPDAADEGISETGLNEHFYTFLSKMTESQILIIENDDPPTEFAGADYSTLLTGNPDLGRAGFFPR